MLAYGHALRQECTCATFEVASFVPDRFRSGVLRARPLSKGRPSCPIAFEVASFVEHSKQYRIVRRFPVHGSCPSRSPVFAGRCDGLCYVTSRRGLQVVCPSRFQALDLCVVLCGQSAAPDSPLHPIPAARRVRSPPVRAPAFASAACLDGPGAVHRPAVRCLHGFRRPPPTVNRRRYRFVGAVRCELAGGHTAPKLRARGIQLFRATCSRTHDSFAGEPSRGAGASEVSLALFMLSVRTTVEDLSPVQVLGRKELTASSAGGPMSTLGRMHDRKMNSTTG